MVENVMECPSYLIGLECLGCARVARRGGASLGKRNTRGRFRDFFVVDLKRFRRAENCFVAAPFKESLTG
jgi:hypothetical protein